MFRWWGNGQVLHQIVMNMRVKETALHHESLKTGKLDTAVVVQNHFQDCLQRRGCQMD